MLCQQITLTTAAGDDRAFVDHSKLVKLMF